MSTVGFRKMIGYPLIIVCTVLGTLSSRGTNYFDIIKVPYLFGMLYLLPFIVEYKRTNRNGLYSSIVSLLLVCSIASIINNDAGVYNCLLLLILFRLSSSITDRSVYMLLLGVSLSQFVFIIVYGFSNTFNGHAVCTAMSYIAILSLISHRYKNRISLLVLLFTIGFFTLYLIDSRTSLIGYTIGSLLILRNAALCKYGSIPLKYYLLTFVLLGCAYYFKDSINQTLINKWENQGYENVSTFTGREIIWIQELSSDWTLFGHGEDYITEVYNHYDAHNIFVQALSRFGSLAFVLMVFIAVYAIHLFRRIDMERRNVFLPIFITYLIIGLAENVSFLDCKMFIPSIIFILLISRLFNIASS